MVWCSPDNPVKPHVYGIWPSQYLVPRNLGNEHGRCCTTKTKGGKRLFNNVKPAPKEPENAQCSIIYDFLLLSNSDPMLIKPALLVPRRRLQAQAVCAGSAGCPASPADFDHHDEDVVVRMTRIYHPF